MPNKKIEIPHDLFTRLDALGAAVLTETVHYLLSPDLETAPPQETNVRQFAPRLKKATPSIPNNKVHLRSALDYLMLSPNWAFQIGKLSKKRQVFARLVADHYQRTNQTAIESRQLAKEIDLQGTNIKRNTVSHRIGLLFRVGLLVARPRSFEQENSHDTDTSTTRSTSMPML
jgi:hypothetical protein